MTLLAIDAGNSRIKWALHDGLGWIASGAIPKTEMSAMRAPWLHLSPPTSAIGCNVAGLQVQQEIEKATQSQGLAIRWAASRAEQCGVRNLYDDATQLGTDRWVALIAARQRMLAAGGTPSATIVLSAGTAVTIDALTSSGEFIGGVILPGASLMADSLEEKTASLKRQTGQFKLFPTNTADAIATGTLIAVGGALYRIEQALHARGEQRCEVLITGGGAGQLQSTLERKTQLIPNLVLEGLRIIAQE